MPELAFDCYEQCYDSKGWMYLKAWYIDRTNNKRVWFYADE